MGILERIERGLERAINGAFAKTFRSSLQPVELTSALRRELDTHSAIVTRDRILVPNDFALRVSPADHATLSRLGDTLTTELTSYVKEHAKAQNYQFAGPVTVRLQPDESLAQGMLRVESKNVSESEVRWAGVLNVGGTDYPLHRGVSVVGRGRDADITIDDSGASRRHAEIAWDGQHAQIRDLGSTNGIRVAGEKVASALLEPDTVVQIGNTYLVFKVVAQQQAPSRQSSQAPRRGGTSPRQADNTYHDSFWDEP